MCIKAEDTRLGRFVALKFLPDEVAKDEQVLEAVLELGRAYALAGDSAKAKSSYQQFLTMWKNANPEVSVLKQTQAEFAKLQ